MINKNKVAAAFGLLAGIVGFTVLIGWHFEIEFLKRPIPNLVTMNPVTAVGFIFSGLSVFLITQRAEEKKQTVIFSNILAVSIVLIGGTKLTDVILALNIDIEHWFYSSKILTDSAGLSNRISPATAFNFVLLGSALLLTNPGNSKQGQAANLIAISVLLISVFFTLGYVYSVPEFKEILNTYPMAIHSAICFQLSAIAVMLINHDKGFMNAFSSAKQGGYVARVFITATLIIPFVGGLALVFSVNALKISPAMTITIGVLLIISINLLIAWYISTELNKINISRDEAEVELTKKNKELQLSQERFFKIFKSSPVPTNIVTIKDGRFVHTNHAFLKLIGRTREEVIGKTSLELNMVDPEIRAALRQKAKENNYNLPNVEVDIRDTAGTVKHIISSTETIDIAGELHMLSTLVDISERKKFEDELIKSRKNLNDAQKLSRTGSWEFNLKTQDLFWSEELYTLFELEPMPAEELYQACRSKMHPDDINNLDDAIKLAQEKGETIVYDHRVILNDGSTRYLLGLGEIIYDNDGKPEWLRGTTQDITERTIFEQKLRQNNIQLDLKNKELEQFAFIASHDLQEPLRTINSFTDLFKEEYSSTLDTNANTYLRFISQSANRMRDLINGLLEYSRLGNKMILKDTDCNEVLKRALENLQIRIKETGTIIKTEQLPVLKAFPIELELLFQNLISNSIKFRKKDVAPEITINAVKNENEWLFSFADNGIGIDPKFFEKIFKLFQRLHSRDVYEGSGIGLSHCKKIVELHNGQIWLESTPGNGTVFYFTMPAIL